MKKIGILSVMAMLLLAVGVSATPFAVHKFAEVTGDFVWDGSSWDDRTGKWNEPVTATYDFGAFSPLSTSAFYTETEKLGTAWKYSLDMDLYVDNIGATRSVFNAITLNDPMTTPATGGYTQYGFSSISTGDFSTTSLAITGEGAVFADVNTMFDSAFTQINQVRVNE